MPLDYQPLAGQLIETYEGFRSRPYQDATGRWTIGFGTTVLPNGQPVTASTPPVSLATARNFYGAQLPHLHAAILAHVEPILDTGQEAALVDFCYNLGVTAFVSSTLLRLLNAGDRAAAAAEFPKWDHEKVNGQEIEASGLLKRRKAEQALFLRGY